MTDEQKIIKQIGPCSETTNNLIRERMSTHYALDANAMDQMLISTKSVIAGSYVLYCQLKALDVHMRWSCTDMDIWITTQPTLYINPVECFHQIVANAGYIITRTWTMRDYVRKEMIDNEYKRLSDHVEQIITYVHRNGNRQIQFIVLKEYRTSYEEGVRRGKKVKNEASDVVKSFDLDICQFAYDGEIAYSLSELVMNTSNRSINMSLNKVALQQQSPFEWIRTFERIEKYAKRGFNFVDNIYDIVRKIIQDMHEHHTKICNSYQRTLFKYTNEDLVISPFYGRIYVSQVKQSLATFAALLNRNNAMKIMKISFEYDKKTSEFTMKLFDFTQNDNVGLPFSFDFLDKMVESWEKEYRKLKNVIVQYKEAHGNHPWNIPPVLINNIPNASHKQVTIPFECFNFIEFDNAQIKTYLDQEPNSHIVLIDPSERYAICSSRENLSNFIEDYSYVYFPCVGKNGSYPVSMDIYFVKIPLQSQQFYVPYHDVEEVIDEKQVVMYKIFETDVIIPSTSSAEAVLNQNYVSADHCQAGTSKRIHRLQPLHVY